MTQKQRPRSLGEILAGADTHGLLAAARKPVARAARPSERELARFDEILGFVDREHRRPEAFAEAFDEQRLARALAAITASPGACERLAPYDRHALLPVRAPGAPEPAREAPAPKAPPKSLAELMTSPLARNPAPDIYAGASAADERKHRSSPDEIAERRRCPDFESFRPALEAVARELKIGTAESVEFAQGSQIGVGDAFILRGSLCVVADVLKDKAGHKRDDLRLRVVFDNGTESDLLHNSLARSLYKDKLGMRVLRDRATELEGMAPLRGDKRTGQVYIVGTATERPEFADLQPLYKIGFTRDTAAKRTANATRDPAFLEAPVRILTTFECYNLNPRRFEEVLHAVLHAQRVEMTYVDRHGKQQHPKEWFAVPLETAVEVARRIINGTIADYRMDNVSRRLVVRREAE